ncbi:alpha/beta fold hydrolase [Arsukibacterium indicum]|uniref:Proline iminopeptidase n=1 Tax=Arsukibacterium indicum TaxID=2848612 RepID=A0ABS6MRG0_9GAMM|nr:alpha/beta fold hydrolase [Arsukibacterium indicum]MBV2130931.1 alpha/beta fold hydrolase [Arsukibacterium indicum]
MPYLNVGDGHQLFAGLRRPVIFIDQRGCGLSRFNERLHANTTAELIADIEQLRRSLAIKRLMLAGGSWGSTLSLLYAIHYPDHVLRLILWGVFLCRRQELDWFYLHGANQMYPDEYQQFINTIGRHDQPLQAYYELLNSGKSHEQDSICPCVSAWQLDCALPQSRLQITPHSAHDASEPENFAALRAILQTLEPEE